MSSEKRSIVPSRHIVAVFTYVSLLPLVYFIPPWVVNNVTDNHLLATLLTLLIIVPLVSYVAVPLLVGMFKRLANR